MRRRHSLLLPSGGGGGGSSGGPTDLPGFKLDFYEPWATTVPEGSLFAVSGDHAKGLGAYAEKWGAQTYQTTYGKSSGAGDYYGINNMSVVSGISGADGNCLQMRLYIDGNGKKVGCNPFANTTDTPGSSSASSSQTYGRYEVRYIATSTKGWKTAWMIWPQSWQWDFEIDWLEGDLNGNIGANNHWPSPTHSASRADGFSTSALYTSWHTTACEWTPSGVKIFLDGVLIGTSTKVPMTAGFMMMQSENSLSGGSSQPTSTGYIWCDYYAQWLWVG